MAVFRWSGKKVLPERVQVRWIGRAPYVCIRDAFVSYTTTNGIAFTVVTPLLARHYHALIRVAAKTALNSLKNLFVDLTELVHHSKRKLQ